MSIKLRRIQENDLEMIMKWRMSPEVTKYMYTDPHLDIKQQRLWYQKVKDDISTSYWIIIYNGSPIGLVSLNNIDYKNKRCSMGHYIAEVSYRGKGIWSAIEYNLYNYIFYEVNLNKLYFEMLSFNENAIDLHKKLGCEIEGVLKQHICKNGQFLDVVIMGMTKDKWETIKGSYQYEKIEIE